MAVDIFSFTSFTYPQHFRSKLVRTQELHILVQNPSATAAAAAAAKCWTWVNRPFQCKPSWQKKISKFRPNLFFFGNSESRVKRDRLKFSKVRLLLSYKIIYSGNVNLKHSHEPLIALNLAIWLNIRFSIGELWVVWLKKIWV